VFVDYYFYVGALVRLMDCVGVVVEPRLSDINKLEHCFLVSVWFLYDVLGSVCSLCCVRVSGLIVVVGGCVCVRDGKLRYSAIITLAGCMLCLRLCGRRG